MTTGSPSALRGRAITFRANPFEQSPGESLMHYDDALIVLRAGRVAAVGDHGALSKTLAPDIRVTHYPDAIICEGLIDTPVHYPQMQLLAWLNKYTFATEQQFYEKAHADTVAALFFRELLRCGTTTAAVYCTVHPHSVGAFFEVPGLRGLASLLCAMSGLLHGG